MSVFAHKYKCSDVHTLAAVTRKPPCKQNLHSACNFLTTSTNQALCYLNQCLRNWCSKFNIAKFWGVLFFLWRPPFIKIPTTTMYFPIEKRHGILTQYHGNNIEVKINYHLLFSKISQHRDTSFKKTTGHRYPTVHLYLHLWQ